MTKSFDGKNFESETERNKYAFENKKELIERDKYILGGLLIILLSLIPLFYHANSESPIFVIVVSIIFLSIPIVGWFKTRSEINKYSNFYKKHLNEIKEEKIKRRRQKLAREKFEKLQREKGLELFEKKWVDKKEIPRLKEIKIGLNKNFQDLSPYEFEKFIAKLFKAMNYKTRVTQASNDYGIDVVAEKGNEKIAIQCKRYRQGNPVGNVDVQKLLGAMQLKNVQATHSILITTSHFTVQAKEQAKECAIELWDKHILHKMVRKYLMKI